MQKNRNRDSSSKWSKESLRKDAKAIIIGSLAIATVVVLIRSQESNNNPQNSAPVTAVDATLTFANNSGGIWEASKLASELDGEKGDVTGVWEQNLEDQIGIPTPSPNHDYPIVVDVDQAHLNLPGISGFGVTIKLADKK